MARTILFSLLALFTTFSAQAEDINRAPLIYVIPVQHMVEPALLYVVRRGIDEATRKNADAIILKMDTTGGRVDSAVAIVEAIGRAKMPVYTFVDAESISAGAMIALSTSRIYMRPGAVIGDITPISMGMTGGVQDLPEAEKEKMTSYVAAHVRAAAEQGGHDPDLAEAMVRRDLEYRDGDNIIIPSGHVLTMTNREAEQLVGEPPKPLLSQGTVNSMDDMLKNIPGLSGAETVMLKVTASEHIARLIAKLAPLLMLIGLGGLWLEIKTPGFGIFGILGGTCLFLFFLGHHIAGLAGFEDVLIFILGVALLAIEVFITPGFGVMGIGGLLLIFLSFISAMSEHVPGEWRPVSFSPETFSVPLLNVTLAFAGSILLVLAAGRFLPQTELFQHLTLKEAVPDAQDDETLLGLEGVAHSDLRPSGSACVDGRKIDVITSGNYIARQTPVRVVEVHGNRIVVEAI